MAPLSSDLAASEGCWCVIYTSKRKKEMGIQNGEGRLGKKGEGRRAKEEDKAVDEGRSATACQFEVLKASLSDFNISIWYGDINVSLASHQIGFIPPSLKKKAFSLSFRIIKFFDSN